MAFAFIHEFKRSGIGDVGYCVEAILELNPAQRTNIRRNRHRDQRHEQQHQCREHPGHALRQRSTDAGRPGTAARQTQRADLRAAPVSRDPAEDGRQPVTRNAGRAGCPQPAAWDQQTWRASTGEQSARTCDDGGLRTIRPTRRGRGVAMWIDCMVTAKRPVAPLCQSLHPLDKRL